MLNEAQAIYPAQVHLATQHGMSRCSGFLGSSPGVPWALGVLWGQLISIPAFRSTPRVAGGIH